MQENVIEFNFVCSRDAVKIKEFLDKVPRSIECINYMTILNKLVKNDYLQYEPSDAVVSSYLIKSLQQVLTSSSTRCLYYVVSDTDYQTLNSIMSYAESQSDIELEYIMHHTRDVNLSEVKDLFKQIIEFD